MTKENFQHVLPPEGNGRVPLEYSVMPDAERFIARIASDGPGEELLSAAQFAGAIDGYAQWARDAWRKGRGPRVTRCGRITMFRREDIIAWLRFLARHHKTLKRTAKAA